MALDPKNNAWLLFGLAALCILSASMYAWLDKDPKKSPEPSQGPDFDEPDVVEAMPAAPVNPSTLPQLITTTAPASNPPATGTVGVIPVYPGGWAWNPAWHHSYYWDMRRDPHWRYDWRHHDRKRDMGGWGNDHPWGKHRGHGRGKH